MYRKKALCLALVFLVALASAACSDVVKPTNSDSLTVSVTIDVVYEFAKEIAEDRVTIHKIVPDGVAIHDFEPKARDIAALSDSDLFIIIGLGMEPWTEKIQSENLLIIEASNGITPLHAGDDHAHDHDHDHDHGDEYDPHIWLSLKCAAQMVSNITDALCGISPENKEFFEGNCQAYLEKLDDLHKEYEQKFKVFEKKDFVTSHAAFAYMCRDYGLIQNGVSGVFAEGEPVAKKIAELTDFCKENSISVIFAEHGESSQIQDTLARQTGARMETLYTIEVAENGKSYIERMSHNLSVIHDSLGNI